MRQIRDKRGHRRDEANVVDRELDSHSSDSASEVLEAHLLEIEANSLEPYETTDQHVWILDSQATQHVT